MAANLSELLADLKEDEAISLVEEQISQGTDPLSIMAEARDGMRIVGERFASGTYFIPDLIFSGEILKAIAAILEPHIKKSGGVQERKGKIVLGTVEGDIHDIGKDMVGFMLDAAGYDVIDLGVDVPVQGFVDAVKSSEVKVVALSGFLTLAFGNMKKTVDALQAAGLRDGLKIMIGGGQVDDDIVKHTGADAYGTDANAAVVLANQWMGG